MAVEVEIKLKINNPRQLTENLEKLGFTVGKKMLESDTYFNSEQHDFVKLGEALRVRTVRDLETEYETAVITYKGKKLDNRSMAREELEIQIADAETGKLLLKRIGFHAVPIVEKIRNYLHREEMTACVDQVKGLGDYLELEIIVGTEAERETALQKIETVLEKLGYSMKDTTRHSYLSMLTEMENNKYVSNKLV